MPRLFKSTDRAICGPFLKLRSSLKRARHIPRGRRSNVYGSAAGPRLNRPTTLTSALDKGPPINRRARGRRSRPPYTSRLLDLIETWLCISRATAFEATLPLLSSDKPTDRRQWFRFPITARSSEFCIMGLAYTLGGSVFAYFCVTLASLGSPPQKGKIRKICMPT
jgi:hypothetical protein